MSTTNIDGSRDAELGRIFRECLEGLAEAEKEYIDKNPRMAKDVRQSALLSLAIIGEAFLKAKRIKLSTLNADNLPWPLHVLMAELGDVSKGRASPLLTPDTSRERPCGTAARNRVKAHQKAEAIKVYSALSDLLLSTDKAASEVAKIFQDRGIKANGKAPILHKNKAKREDAVTPETVKEWKRQSCKQRNRNNGLLSDELDAIDEAMNEFLRIKYACRLAGEYQDMKITPSPVIGFYSVEAVHYPFYDHHEFSDADQAGVLLSHLGRYIDGTAYD